MTDIEKKRTKVLANINRFQKAQESKGINISLGFGSDEEPRGMCSTGIPSLDFMLGGRLGTTQGGFPRGTFTLVGGKRGACKTTMALKSMHAAITAGDLAAYANLEESYDKEYTTQQFNGEEAKIRYMLKMEADDLETALDFLIHAMDNKMVSVACIDTINGKAARGEIRDKKGTRSVADKTVAEIPRVLSAFFRRATSSCANANTAVVLLGQIRMAGIGSGFVHEHIPGGHALMHYTRLEIYQRRGPQIVINGQKILAFPVIWTVRQAQIGHGINEWDTFETVFFVGQGFDPHYEALNIAYACGLLEKSSDKSLRYTFMDGTKILLRGSRTSLVTSVLNSMHNLKDYTADQIAEDMITHSRQVCTNYHTSRTGQAPLFSQFLEDMHIEETPEDI